MFAITQAWQMTIFSVSAALTGPPQLYYGFWYSHDSTQTRGYMLTLSNFLASYLTLALGMLVVWAVSRLWRIGCALLFYFSYQPEPSWEESQNNVFIVNNKDPLDGFIESYEILRNRTNAYRRDSKGRRYNLPQGSKPPRYRRARNVVIMIMLAGMITVSLKLSIPLLIALVPVTRMGLVVPRGCGEGSVGQEATVDEITAKWYVRKAKWVNVAFATIDRIVSNQPLDIGDSTEGIGRSTLPEPELKFDHNCPGNVSACSSKHPFTFSSEYTLSAQHFGLNVKTPFSFRVSESCYRPTSMVSPIDPPESLRNSSLATTNVTAYGLFYGPRLFVDGPSYKYTTSLNNGQLKAGYAVTRVSAKANDSDSDWSPYPSIIQGGDTTLLVYYIGGVLMLNTSSDPMFCTKEPPYQQFHTLESPFVPIICDTKYVFCDTSKDGDGCSDSGGLNTLLGWLEDRQSKTWQEMGTMLAEFLSRPPIFRAANGPGAVLAAQSADGAVQYAPNNITAFRELSRLSSAGMVMVASIAQLYATGFWTNDMPLTDLRESKPDSICYQVIMESSAVTTIPVIPYLVFVVFSVFIVVISYSSSFRLSRRIFFSPFERLFKIWALHLPGQLHRELTERLRTRDFKNTSTTDGWPTAPYQSGPTITRQGLTRFASGLSVLSLALIILIRPTGSTGLLDNMPEDMEEYPLNTLK